MRKQILTIFITTLLVVMALLQFGAWDASKPADSDLWNNAAGFIRTNNDALETAFGTGLVNAGALTVFNVQNPPYNATGDGSTDDTTAIAAAEAAAVAAGGGIVFFPEGTYIISGTDAGAFRRGIQITGDNLIFMGVGEGSIIKQSTTIGEAMHCFSTTSNVVPAKNLRFTQLMFQGNGLCDSSSGSSGAFQFALFEGIEIDHCSFADFRANFNGATGTTTISQRLRFHHNTVFGGDSNVSAVGVKCQFAKELWINDNEFRKVARPLAIELNSSSIYTITSVWFCRNLITEGTKTTFGCVSDSYTGCQISGTDASNVINDIHITDNVFKSNSLGTGANAYDIFINGADSAETVEGVIIKGNTFIDLNGNGNTFSVYILNAHRNIVSENMFLEPAVVIGPAIRVRGLGGSVGSTENIISNNIIAGTNWGSAIQEDTDIATAHDNIFWNNHDTTFSQSYADLATTQSIVFSRSAAQTMNFQISELNNTSFMTNTGMQLGTNSTDQGILTLWDGAGGNTPGNVVFHSPDGTAYYSFVDDDGLPKIHTSTPTATTQGNFVGMLISVTTIPLNANGDTTIFTVPTGKRLILTKALLVGGADAGTSDISIGQNGAETDFVGVTNLDNLNAEFDTVLIAPIPSATPATLKSYAATTIIEAQVANQAGGATNTLYLYGTLY